MGLEYVPKVNKASRCGTQNKAIDWAHSDCNSHRTTGTLQLSEQCVFACQVDPRDGISRLLVEPGAQGVNSFVDGFLGSRPKFGKSEAFIVASQNPLGGTDGGRSDAGRFREYEARSLGGQVGPAHD
jgi:hypothetical protein